MKYKIDRVLAYIWLAILPIYLAAIVLFVVLWDYRVLNFQINDDVFLNANGLIAVIYFAGWIINLSVSLFHWIVGRAK